MAADGVLSAADAETLEEAMRNLNELQIEATRFKARQIEQLRDALATCSEDEALVLREEIAEAEQDLGQQV